MTEEGKFDGSVDLVELIKRIAVIDLDPECFFWL